MKKIVSAEKFQEEYLVIGMYLGDDEYFYFRGIKDLQGTKRKLYGKFFHPSNSSSKIDYLMKLVVYVDYGTNQRPPTTKIDVDFESKICTFCFSQEDFANWFIDCDEWVKNNGPSWRDGNINVYIRTNESKDHESFRDEVLREIQRAERMP